MDNDLANIIRNNIPNDYCKRLCLDVMEGEKKITIYRILQMKKL